MRLKHAWEGGGAGIRAAFSPTDSVRCDEHQHTRQVFSAPCGIAFERNGVPYTNHALEATSISLAASNTLCRAACPRR